MYILVLVIGIVAGDCDGGDEDSNPVVLLLLSNVLFSIDNDNPTAVVPLSLRVMLLLRGLP